MAMDGSERGADEGGDERKRVSGGRGAMEEENEEDDDEDEEEAAAAAGGAAPSERDRRRRGTPRRPAAETCARAREERMNPSDDANDARRTRLVRRSEAVAGAIVPEVLPHLARALDAHGRDR